MAVLRVTLLKEERVRVDELTTPASARASSNELYDEGLFGEAIVLDAAIARHGRKARWEIAYTARCYALPDSLYAAWLRAKRAGERYALVCDY